MRQKILKLLGAVVKYFMNFFFSLYLTTTTTTTKHIFQLDKIETGLFAKKRNLCEKNI